MQPQIPTALLDRISAVSTRYGLLPDRDIAVATSGGKDSVFACLALRELGHHVTPVLVDMGFTQKWSSHVSANLTSLGFNSIQVIEPRKSIPADQRVQTDFLKKNLLILDSIADDGLASATPCTSCYNSKVLSLEQHFENLDVGAIAFAHHASDAVSSALKSGLMYIDRFDHGNEVYERDRFVELARDSYNKIVTNDMGFAARIGELSQSGVVTTDEPPRQALTPESSVNIVRPLLHIWESEIQQIVDRMELAVEPSGCGHSVSPLTQTPREIVLYQLTRRIERDHDIAKEKLLAIAFSNIDEVGRLTSDARRSRQEILGPAYKPPAGGINKL